MLSITIPTIKIFFRLLGQNVLADIVMPGESIRLTYYCTDVRQSLPSGLK